MDDVTVADDVGMSDERNVTYWNRWNRQWRFIDGVDDFMRRQQDVARSVVGSRFAAGPVRILDIGCGTGWLAASVSEDHEAWGIDLSPDAIAEGQRRHPALHLQSGDFFSAELPLAFDLVISADSLCPMPDYGTFASRVAELQSPGGVFLLMTQSPFVWHRRSRANPVDRRWKADAVDAAVPHATVDSWPTLRDVRKLFRPYYRIDSVTTVAPGGDRGVLWWVENRYVRGGMSRIIGRSHWDHLLERGRLGRELVVVATRT